MLVYHWKSQDKKWNTWKMYAKDDNILWTTITSVYD